MDPYDLGLCRTPGDIDIWVKPADPCGLDIAVADLDGKGAHGVYTERSRSKRYHGKEAVIEYVKMLWRLEDSKFAQKGQTPLCKNEEPEVRYHHIDAPAVNGVEVEAHFRPLFLDSPLRNWRLQRWFRENEQFNLCSAKFAQEATGVFRGLTECQSGPTKGSKSPLATVEGTPLCKKSVDELVESIPTPTVSFNAVYQLLHIYKHLFEEGIGLRQLLDYYFVLRALHLSDSNSSNGSSSSSGGGSLNGLSSSSGSSGLCGGLNCPKGIEPIEPLEPQLLNQAQAVEPIEPLDPQKAEIMHTLSRFGMRKFASATMYVLQTVFAMPDVYLLCPPNEKEGKFLLNEIMQAGNFGKYDTRISHSTSQMGHAWEKLKHNFRLIRHYPEEVLWEPFFRIYHYLWRKFRLWRF